MIVTLVRATTDAVSLAEVKAHCRIDDDESDAALRIFRDAASEYIAEETGLILQPTTLQYRTDEWPCRSDGFELPRSPVRDVTALTYFDADGVEQTVSLSDWSWEMRHDGAVIWFGSTYSLPSLESNRRGAVRVTFDAGFNAPDDDGTGSDPNLHLPAMAKQAVLLLVGHWFENRETVTVATMFKELPLALDSLIGKLKVFR